jgi:hypothetical protein
LPFCADYILVELGGCLCTGSGVWGETDYMFALVEM